MNNSASHPATGPAVYRGRWFGVLVMLAGIYFLAARAGLLLASVHGSASPVWPATGIAIAALVLGGARYWPAILVGAFAANALTNVPVWAAGLIAVGNTLEALAGAWALRRVRRAIDPTPFAEPAAVCVSAVIGPVISASWGVGSLWLAGELPVAACATVGLTWFAGDALGALVVVPAALAGARVLTNRRVWKREEAWLAAGLAVAGVVIAGLVFLRVGGTAFLFLLFPWLFAVTAAFRAAGACLGAFGLAVISVIGTACGLGPFASTSLNDNLLNLQLFLAAATVTAMMLPAFRPRAGWWLPAAVLLVGWALSGWLFATLEEERSDVDRKRILALVEQAERDVAQRMRTYEDAMRGGVSLFATDQNVDADRWRAYVETLELFERYPGVYGLGVIFPVQRGLEAGFVAYQQETFVPEFKIHPVPGTVTPPEMKERFVITYIEPLLPNLKARGLEISSERRRREGAMVARDEGRPVISDSVILVQDGEARPGFMFFMPMYRNGQPKETTAERRASFLGWVYAPFVTEQLFAGALTGHLGELSVEIYDAPEMTAERRVFTGGAARLKERGDNVVKRSELGGRVYTYVWGRGAEFVSNHNSASVWAASCAAIVSLLMAGLVLALQTTGQRANAIADERTAALATNEARMRAILDTALDGVVMLNDRGEVIEWNPQAERIFGWKRAEALGTRLLELMLPERFERVRQMGFKRFLDGRAERVLDRRVEVTARDRNGREFPCELAMVTIRGNGGVWLSLFLRDISERRHVEEALLAAKKAAEAGTRAKSDFLATMSHEIRTPMNGVIGFARLLLDTPLTEQQREFARIIQTSGDNLLELINGILDLSRVEAGKLEVQKVRFNFQDVLQPVVQLLGPRADEKSVLLACDYPKDAPRWLLGDATRVRQVLINLTGNALKFTERGTVRIVVRADGGCARVEVHDTGPGISPEKQALLFQKFSQGDASTTRRFGGSGLGLAIAKELVGLMGGAIGVRSAEGKGSVFWFTLPVAEMPANTRETTGSGSVVFPEKKVDTLSPITGTERGKLRVLLAEDNAINQMLARAYLESMGCIVELAETGVEAVAKTEADGYDGVLMDCHMPELDGFLATRAIRVREQKKGATRRLGIVALTASAMEEDRQRCLAAGMDGHLMKPLQPEKLREWLEQWAREKSVSA